MLYNKRVSFSKYEEEVVEMKKERVVNICLLIKKD